MGVPVNVCSLQCMCGLYCRQMHNVHVIDDTPSATTQYHEAYYSHPVTLLNISILKGYWSASLASAPCCCFSVSLHSCLAHSHAVTFKLTFIHVLLRYAPCCYLLCFTRCLSHPNLHTCMFLASLKSHFIFDVVFKITNILWCLTTARLFDFALVTWLHLFHDDLAMNQLFYRSCH